MSPRRRKWTDCRTLGLAEPTGSTASPHSLALYWGIPSSFRWTLLYSPAEASSSTDAKPGSSLIRVLAVDDSATIRETLSVLIEAQPDMDLIGSAASGHEAVRRAAELQPDIVLMDIHMPDLDGIQATWLVSSRAPHGAVIMVTSEERIDFIQKAMSAGAQGYVLKPFGDGTQLLQTVRETHARVQARQLQLGSAS